MTKFHGTLDELKSAVESCSLKGEWHDILHIEFNDHVREIVPNLAQRLQGAGFQIDPKKIAEASA